MRLLITCEVPRPIAIPVNHQYELGSLVYGLLRAADPEYARFLHEEGYGGGESARRYKLFCFSGLRCARRRVDGETLWLGPGAVTWQIGSPSASFLQPFATGLLAAGGLTVGAATLPVASVQALPPPDFSSGTARFTCLTPIVAALPIDNGGTRYLRPCEGAEFSTAVRNNLLRKYQALHVAAFADEADLRFDLTFDAEYLADPRHRQGTKLIAYKGIQIVGAQAPFVIHTNAPALLELLYDAGCGEKSSAGFGMLQAQEGRSR